MIRGYTSRNRVVYWDDRNGSREWFVSGIHFYQPRTNDVSPFEKMVILKQPRFIFQRKEVKSMSSLKADETIEILKRFDELSKSLESHKQNMEYFKADFEKHKKDMEYFKADFEKHKKNMECFIEESRKVDSR